MRGRIITTKYVVANARQAHRSDILNVYEWKKNLKMANRQSRATIARRRGEGLEFQYALTDLKRNIIKKVMMTPDQAYQKNKVTKALGMAWVQCG